MAVCKRFNFSYIIVDSHISNLLQEAELLLHPFFSAGPLHSPHSFFDARAIEHEMQRGRIKVISSHFTHNSASLGSSWIRSQPNSVVLATSVKDFIWKNKQTNSMYENEARVSLFISIYIIFPISSSITSFQTVFPAFQHHWMGRNVANTILTPWPSQILNILLCAAETR